MKKNMYEEEIQKKYEGADVKRKDKYKNKIEEEAKSNAEKREKEKWKRNGKEEGRENTEKAEEE